MQLHITVYGVVVTVKTLITGRYIITTVLNYMNTECDMCLALDQTEQ